MTKSEAYDILTDIIRDQNVMDWIYDDGQETVFRIALMSIVQTADTLQTILHRQEGEQDG